MKEKKSIWLLGYVAGSHTLKQLREFREELLLRYAPFYLENGEEQILQDMKDSKDSYYNIIDTNEYDITWKCEVAESGLLDALWQLGEALNTGLRVYLDRISIRQISIELADYYDVNPYEKACEDVYLLVTDCMEEELAASCVNGTKPVRIGCLTQDNARVIINGENIRYLSKVQSSTAAEV